MINILKNTAIAILLCMIFAQPGYATNIILYSPTKNAYTAKIKLKDNREYKNHLAYELKLIDRKNNIHIAEFDRSLALRTYECTLDELNEKCSIDISGFIKENNIKNDGRQY